MKKLNKNTYRGIEYIRLSSLSVAHAEALRSSLNNRTLIKILRNEVILSDCVLYSAYEAWYNSFVLMRSQEPVFNYANQPEAILTSA
jgi:hypothetical protein